MKNHLQLILPENKIKEFLSIGKTNSVRAFDYYIRAGVVPCKLAYVISGLFRYVYFDEKGNEFTKGIITENNFISSYSAMVLKRPSYFFIEALENSQIFEITWPAFTALMDKDIFWVKFLLKFIEKGFITKEKRERELLLLDAETRYRNFLTEFPGIDQRIKQSVIASYLGIKPETLSRIRRRTVI